MIAYCIKQILRGGTTLLLASLLLFTLLTYGPSGAWEQLEKYPAERRPSNLLYYYMHIDFEYMRRPWPISYFLWLFDPMDVQDYDYSCYCFVPRGLDIHVGALNVGGSGVLTGHIGASTHLAPGQPVLSEALMGRGSMLLFESMSALIALAMIAAIRRRWNTRDLIHPESGPESHIVTWHYFSFPPPLIGWYKRGLRVSDSPTFRLY